MGYTVRIRSEKDTKKIKEMTNKEKDIRREWMEFKQKSHKQEKVIVTKENINKVFSQIFN